MKINIKTTNLVLTPAIEKAIEEKIVNLEYFISKVDSLVEAWVEVGLVTRHHHKGNIYRAEINIQVPGKILRAEAERKNLNLALAEVKDELQGQLKKYKGRPQTLKKRGAL